MYFATWNMNRHQLNVFTALIKVLDKELLTTLLFSKCKTLAFMLLWYIACLDGAKIDGQHDVDDLCRNNYLINVKIYSHIYLHTTSNIQFYNCFLQNIMCIIVVMELSDDTYSLKYPFELLLSICDEYFVLSLMAK